MARSDIAHLDRLEFLLWDMSLRLITKPDASSGQHDLYPANFMINDEKIKRLEDALKVIHTWASCDQSSNEPREKAMADIAKTSQNALFPSNTEIGRSEK